MPFLMEIIAGEVRQVGAWTRSRAAACGCPWSCGAFHCLLASGPRTLSIAPGASYTATIRHNQDVPFPDGTYRLVLAYDTAPPSSLTATVSTDPFPITAVLLPPPACPYTAAFAPRERPA